MMYNVQNCTSFRIISFLLYIHIIWAHYNCIIWSHYMSLVMWIDGLNEFNGFELKWLSNYKPRRTNKEMRGIFQFDNFHKFSFPINSQGRKVNMAMSQCHYSALYYLACLQMHMVCLLMLQKKRVIQGSSLAPIWVA